MLGQRAPQINLFNTANRLGGKAVDKMGFYADLARNGPEIFRDEDFAELYCADNGRPSAPPSLLAMARLLQHYEGISDAEVIERCRYDLRWKVALDLPLTTDTPFVKSTYQAFRVRLTLHEKEGLVFERSVGYAGTKGLLPKEIRAALDSSPVRGRGAVKDTYNLLSDAIVGVLRALAHARKLSAKALALEVGLERHVDAPSIKGSVEVDWSNPAAVSEFLKELLADCDKVLAAAAQSGLQGAPVELLQKIIDQDVDRGDDQKPAEIRKGVAPGRTPSVSDPDMRHGCKSSGAKYNGHKVHVAVDIDSGIITAVIMDEPGKADGAQVEALLEQTKKNTGREIDIALGDCGYSTREAAEQAARAGVELHTKMPGHRKGYYGPGDFEVSEDLRTAYCPADLESARRSSRNAKDGQPAQVRHTWNPAFCGACPLKAGCTSGKSRTLSVPEDFHERRRREQYARSPEGRQELRQRVGVEHAIGRVKNLGAGKSRYFGRSKTQSQWFWTVAVANLSLIFAFMARGAGIFCVLWVVYAFQTAITRLSRLKSTLSGYFLVMTEKPAAKRLVLVPAGAASQKGGFRRGL